MNQRLRDREYLADQFSYADIAFYMAQFFAARTALYTDGAGASRSSPAWRQRMIGRPAVRTVVTAMADYLRSEGQRSRSSAAELNKRA